jgi:hypothetical protein
VPRESISNVKRKPVINLEGLGIGSRSKIYFISNMNTKKHIIVTMCSNKDKRDKHIKDNESHYGNEIYDKINGEMY